MSTATRLGEIKQGTNLGCREDSLGMTDVFLYDSRQIIALQDQAAVLDCDWIDVHKHHARLRRGSLCDLLHVTYGRHARSDIEKLSDVGLHQELDGAPQERPVHLRQLRRVRKRSENLLGDVPVDREVVGAPSR
jgi:hypothetical protein